jgi:hypothetical protein
MNRDFWTLFLFTVTMAGAASVALTALLPMPGDYMNEEQFDAMVAGY